MGQMFITFKSIFMESYSCHSFHSSRNDKKLDRVKLKAFSGDILNVTQMTKFIFHEIENIVEKEENGGYQHFRLFPLCFQNTPFSGIGW